MLYPHLSNAVCSIIKLFFPGRQKTGGSIPFYTIKAQFIIRYHNNRLTRLVLLNSFILKVAEHYLEAVRIC